MALTAHAALNKDRSADYATMEHRHFATIATIINRLNPEMRDPDERLVVAEHFADELASTNPRFDRARFLRACGV